MAWMLPGELARIVRESKLGTYFRPRDVAAHGVSFMVLKRLVAEGTVLKVAPGLYRLTQTDATEFESIAMAASVVPGGVICLLSALQVHEVGSQVPRQVWIAIDRKARKPTRIPLGVRVVRFSNQMLRYAVEERSLLGVRVRLTSPARTVVDCFRYRNKIGLDVAVEALRDVIRRRLTTIDAILRAADVCRARTVIQPYLEALTT